MGKMKQKPAFAAVFSKSRGINVLSLARFFLFGARDVWFVVALPVFLEMTMDWNFWQVGGFMGLWVVGYGPGSGHGPQPAAPLGATPGPGTLGPFSSGAAMLMVIPALMAVALWRSTVPGTMVQGGAAVILGLAVFGLVFAMNSSIPLLHGAGLYGSGGREPQTWGSITWPTPVAASWAPCYPAWCSSWPVGGAGGHGGVPVGFGPAGGALPAVPASGCPRPKPSA